MNNYSVLEELISKFPQLSSIENQIRDAVENIINCYQKGNKVLICGNGGSCSDSDHIVGELMKGFEKKRPIEKALKSKLMSLAGERGEYIYGKLQQGLPAISLTAHVALTTAVINDIDADLIFAQQVVGYGNTGDILIGISTSGNAQNVFDAAITAKAKGLFVIGLTGKTGGKLKSCCDILINVPEERTAFVQELQLPVYHAICLIVENYFFEK